MFTTPDRFQPRRISAGSVVLAMALAAGLPACGGKVCDCGPALGITITGTGSNFVGIGSNHSFRVILAGDLNATVSCSANVGATGSCSAPSPIAGRVLSSGDLKLEVDARPAKLDVTVVVDGVTVRVAHVTPTYAAVALACGSDCPRSEQAIGVPGP